MTISSFGVQDRQLNDKERWLSFVALFFFSCVAAFNLFKASSVLTYIGADYALDSASIGLIMSAYSLAVVVLAYPGMIIMQKLGVKTAILGACIIMLIGTAIGSVATSGVLFMVSRIIEGAAYGAMHVMCPNAMPRIFPSNRQGLAMGIFSQCVPVATIAAFFVAPIVFDAAGWRAIWMVSIALEIIAIIVIAVFLKLPKVNENVLEQQNAAAESKSSRKLFVGMAIAVAVVFCAWTYDYVGNVNSLYPTFLQEAKGLSVFDSSMLPNVAAIISIPAGIILGSVAQTRKCAKALTVGCYLVFGVMLATIAFTTGSDIIGPWVFCIILGVCSGAVPTTTRVLIPLLALDPKKTDLALTTMSFFAGLGQAIGTYAATSLVAQAGWQVNAQFILAPLAIIAGLVILIFVKSDRKIEKLRAEGEAVA